MSPWWNHFLCRHNRLILFDICVFVFISGTEPLNIITLFQVWANETVATTMTVTRGNKRSICLGSVPTDLIVSLFSSSQKVLFALCALNALTTAVCLMAAALRYLQIFTASTPCMVWSGLMVIIWSFRPEKNCWEAAVSHMIWFLNSCSSQTNTDDVTSSYLHV